MTVGLDSRTQTTAQGAHGVLAALEGAAAAPYGTALVAGCSWATWVKQCQNLTVYSNGGSFNNNGCGSPNGCKFGSEFQCDELGQRYAYYAWGEPATWDGYAGDQGSAYQMWNAGPALPIPLEQFAQGQGIPPQQGDLIVFAPGWIGGYWDAPGHVAVVIDASVAGGYVDIAEQNGAPSGTDRLR